MHFFISKSRVAAIVSMIFILGIPSWVLAQDNDRTLRVVTWNLEWFGSTSNGPSDEFRQVFNAGRVINEIKPDVIGLQEVTSESALEELAGRLENDYSIFYPSHISQDQKMVYLFKDASFSYLGSNAAEGWGSAQGQDSFDWAGRFPYVVLVNYVPLEGDPIRVRFVNIHAKAFDDSDSYLRRRNAARDLYNYIDQNRNSDRLVLLGDYNDDVDVSISNNRVTPYEPFVNDVTDFNIVTATLSEQRATSTVRYGEMIDHITISNELEEELQDYDVYVFDGEALIGSNYGNNTSDHYPVVANLNFGTSTTIADERQIPNSIELKAYPNPFNPSTNIAFELPTAGIYQLTVYNMAGQQVFNTDSRFYSIGSHQVDVRLNNQPSGVYRVLLRNEMGIQRSMSISLIK